MRSPLPVFLLPVLLTAPAGLAGAGDRVPQTSAVALVCRIEGSATLRSAPGAPPEPLASGRRLSPGAVLETGLRSAVTVVFFDGQHQALTAGARATVRAEGLRAEAGKVRRLEPIPVIVDLAPVLREGSPRLRTPAVPIRGGGGADAVIAGLRPRDAAPVRRGAATLSFTPAPNVKVYHVVVEDESGRAIFTKDLFVPPVRVPLRFLRPGTLYQWSVESKVPPRPDLRGEAMFVTLDGKLEKARQALAREAGRTAEPDLRLLLTEVDRGLGLAEMRP